MARFLFSMVFLFGMSSFATTAQDVQAIKSMAGCYNVTFNFHETYTSPGYPVTSKPYAAEGVEYVTVDYETPTEIHLQHVLVGDGWVQKHWRDEWRLQPKSIMSYIDTLTWKTMDITSQANQWVEQVLSVDDSPRYGCLASWSHANHSQWNCTAWAPLPRREYEARNDYNILNRGSHIDVTSTGWRMGETNEKIIAKDNQTQSIAKEEGANVYLPVDKSQCARGEKYWNDTKNIWHVIQETQKEIYAQHPLLKLRKTERNHFLWQELFYLVDQYSQKTTYNDNDLKKDTATILNKFIL